MKHITGCVTVGAWLLLSSVGVLAADPHKFTGTSGQPGTSNGITCNSTVGPGPGGSANGNGSPFNPSVTPPYAGNMGNPTLTGAPGNGNTTAVSQYDVACFQAP